MYFEINYIPLNYDTVNLGILRGFSLKGYSFVACCVVSKHQKILNLDTDFPFEFKTALNLNQALIVNVVLKNKKLAKNYIAIIYPQLSSTQDMSGRSSLTAYRTIFTYIPTPQLLPTGQKNHSISITLVNCM